MIEIELHVSAYIKSQKKMSNKNRLHVRDWSREIIILKI